MSKLKIYFKSILVPVIVGAIVGLFISKSIDYKYLEKPFLAPPGFIFPIVWTILYILMGISYGILKNRNLNDNKIKKIYYLQLFVNALWSIFFFLLKWRIFSFWWIILLDFLVIIMIYSFYNKEKLSGLLQIFYLIWVLFASYLNLTIYLLNK